METFFESLCQLNEALKISNESTKDLQSISTQSIIHYTKIFNYI